MFEKLDIFKMADAMAVHAGSRMSVISGNIANADTPGYKAQDLPDFAATYSQSGTLRTTRSGHIGAAVSPSAAQSVPSGGSEAPNGNSVSLEAEMVKAVQIRQQHDMALSVYQSASRLLRGSLGRSV